MRAALLAVALLVAGPALAQEVRLEGFRPHLTAEVEMGLYGVGNLSRAVPSQQGTSFFLDGDIAAALYLTPQFSVQGAVKFEPVAEVEPNGGTVGMRYQGAFIEQLYAEWRPRDDIRLIGGKFTAPFGRYHDVPGILAPLRAEEVYEISESLGFGATWTYFSDPTFGEHDISAAIFTLDTGGLSNTFFTRQKCCREGFERYSRNSLLQGGSGNTGRLNNYAIALDGDRIGWLPNFAYHLALVSRGPGNDGTAREWGYAAAALYELPLNDTTRVRFFGEYVQFRNAGGRPSEEIALAPGDEGADLLTLSVPAAARQNFSTLGVQLNVGAWRAAAVWQNFQQKRSVNTVPTQNYAEVSLGRELSWGFGLDAGYQYARYATDEGGLAQSNSLIGVLRWRQSF